MHPKRFMQALKDSVGKLSQQNVRDALEFLLEYSDSSNLIVPQENNTIRLLKTENILYVREPKKGRVYIHKFDEEIEFKCSSYDLLEYLDRNCETFKYLNNGLVVNLNKITGYNDFYRKLYFINGDCVDITGAAINYLKKQNLNIDCEFAEDTFNGKMNAIKTQ